MTKARSKKSKLKMPLKGDITGTHPAMPANDKKLPVVGIGASAGGIEALQQFFKAMPADARLAYVVVVHLSPEHQSHLAEILANSTSMPTHQVRGRLELEANHIYVIAPDMELEIADTSVEARSFEEPRGHRNPIDTFFRSMAIQHGDGFGILLSGGGSDGTLGIRTLKEAGGIILVQDPAEAPHPSMPRSAIASGAADFVLPVRQLASQLTELSRNKYRIFNYSANLPDKLDQTDKAVLTRILAHVHARTGHDFSKYKQTTVLRRLMRRMQVHRIESLGSYFLFLHGAPEEAQALFEDLLISVTSFFRDPEAFEELRLKVIPRLFENNKAPLGNIRVWVPGCATGEEAYSIAMLLLEEAERRDEWPQIQVFATDLDESALASAREGRYPQSIDENVSPERLRKFFQHDGIYYRVRKELRDCVLFATHSLLRDPPFSRIDLVSCRNLMIYLERELQERVFGILRYSIRNGGFLFIGSSENADGPYFRALDNKHRIYTTREATEKLPDLPDLRSGRPRILSATDLTRNAPPENAHASEIHRKLLEELAPPSILVNERRGTLHLSETVGRFLSPRSGPLSQDVTELVRAELQAELRTALFRAFDRNESTFTPFIKVGFNGHVRQVALLVQPRQAGENDERLALVVFIEDGEARTPEPGETKADANIVRQLREELHQMQERLQQARKEQEDSHEEYRSANEELQSINEEYRSTAEELETSKEELQSINEELETVNNELKAKLEEISRAHGDLENLMAATDIGTLFLDANMRIRRFTPPLSDFFSVTPSDLGRAIGDFTTTLDYRTLEEDAREVLTKLIPIERQTRSLRNSKVYLVRLRPYRTAKNRIDGVVVTFVDVTEHKKTEDSLRARTRELADNELKLKRQATQLHENDQRKTDFLAMLGHELRNPLAAIRSSIGLLNTVQADDAGRDRNRQKTSQALVILERQARLMTRLVNDLLDVARINQNKIELIREPVILADSIESAVAALRAEIDAKQLKLTVKLPAETVCVYADNERLLQILDNLLSNAVKFTDFGGQIKLTATQEKAEAVIRIKDSGIGISRGAIEHVFDQFTQSHLPNQAGLGLGLSLVKNLAELHGGSIAAHSDGPGKGSEFILRMPLCQTSPGTPGGNAGSGKDKPNSLRMLVIDDNPDVADGLAMLLQTESHEVEVAYDGETACSLAERLRPQVALLDLGMPDMDGFQLAKRLRRKFPSMFLVAVSGHAEDERTQEAGFDHHLLKPISLPMINKVLASLT